MTKSAMWGIVLSVSLLGTAGCASRAELMGAGTGAAVGAAVGGGTIAAVAGAVVGQHAGKRYDQRNR